MTSALTYKKGSISMADKQKQVIRDPKKAYDKNDVELQPGDTVVIRAQYVELAKTDQGADCTVRLHSTPGGYSPVISVHGSQCEKVDD
jgi:hypothetical protein